MRSVALVAVAAVSAAACSGGPGAAGGVRSAAPPARPVSQVAVGRLAGAYPTSIGAVGYLGGRVVVVRRGTLVWESRLRFRRPPAYLDGVAARGRELAFSVWGRGLYLGRLPAAEVRVGRDGRETPVGWTRAGVLVTALGRDLIMRSAHGAVLGRMPVRGSLYDPRSATYLLETRSGWLERTDGLHARRLARLGRRLAAAAIANLPGGRIALFGRGRVRFLSATGRPLASAAFRHGHIVIAAAAESPSGGAFAFVVTHRPAAGRSGVDEIEVVGRGRQGARTVAAVHVTLQGCTTGAVVSHWRGRWLRYRNGDRRVLAIDTTGAHRPVELAARRSPG